MLLEELKNIKSNRKELKKFGILIGVVLAGFSVLLHYHEKDFYLYFSVLSALFLTLGLLIPKLLKPFYKIWMGLSTILGWIMTRVILSVLFYIVVSPIGIILKLSGEKFLKLNLNQTKKSYWNHKNNTEIRIESYRKQF